MSYGPVELFIDGVWRPAEAGRTLPVVDPATGATIGEAAKASMADLDAAIEAARGGFARWRRSAPAERAAVLARAASLLRDRADTVATAMTMEQGKPLAEARGEVMLAGAVLDWFAGEALRSYGRVIPGVDGTTQLTIKEPVGIAAAFTPWNFPINQVVRKVGAAIAAGCAIIVKGPEETPASPAALVAALADAGIPAGVIGLVYGDPAEISGYLIPHPDVRKISFTGSTAVGKQLAALAGQHMKRATMELGGHAPALVFDDADIDGATQSLVGTKFLNAGQMCVSPTRFLVQDKVADAFTAGFVERARALKVGSGMESATQMGPLANERRLSAMETLVADAVDRGARLLAGGRRIGNAGNFYEPTVLADVPLDARVMNEEPFGPMAVINRFSANEDAIVEANRLPYGLAAFAYTRSADTARQVSDGMEAGMIGINHFGLALPETPFGGVKDSGYGSEGGAEAIESYQNTKFVTHLTA